jgi:hypothetical protein
MTVHKLFLTRTRRSGQGPNRYIVVLLNNAGSGSYTALFSQSGVSYLMNTHVTPLHHPQSHLPLYQSLCCGKCSEAKDHVYCVFCCVVRAVPFSTRQQQGLFT